MQQYEPCEFKTGPHKRPAASCRAPAISNLAIALPPREWPAFKTQGNLFQLHCKIKIKEINKYKKWSQWTKEFYIIYINIYEYKNIVVCAKTSNRDGQLYNWKHVKRVKNQIRVKETNKQINNK